MEGEETVAGSGSAEGDTDAQDSTLLILERARHGDRRAAMVLLERAVPGLRRWARGRLPATARADADTEDIVQDALLRTLARISRFQHETVGGLQAYLRIIVVNRIRDLIRRSKRHGTAVPLDAEPLVDDEASPLEVAIRRQHVDAFLDGLQRLAPADRQLIIWRIELGWSVDEIAHRLGKRTPAARMAIRRALERLETALARKGSSERGSHRSSVRHGPAAFTSGPSPWTTVRLTPGGNGLITDGAAAGRNRTSARAGGASRLDRKAHALTVKLQAGARLAPALPLMQRARTSRKRFSDAERGGLWDGVSAVI